MYRADGAQAECAGSQITALRAVAPHANFTMGSAYKIYAALCLLAVCTAGVLGDPETATWKSPDTPQKNVTLQLIGYTAKGTVPAGAEQVGHPRGLCHPRQQILVCCMESP